MCYFRVNFDIFAPILKVLSNVAIEEEWFFGLKYVTQEGYSAWLAPHEKV